jgi:type 1 glutamine amidotransferase
LIVTGNADLPYHRWQETTASLRAILEQTGRFEVRVTEEPRGLTVEALQEYDAVVLNYNGSRWPASAETALESFVRQGKGLLAFHQAIYGTFFGQEFRDQKWHEGPPASGWGAFPKEIACTVPCVFEALHAPAQLGGLGIARFEIFAPVEFLPPSLNLLRRNCVVQTKGYGLDRSWLVEMRKVPA